MRRRLIYLFVAGVLIVTAGVAGALIWRTHVSRHHLTYAQAGPIADRYATDTADHMPGSPRLIGPRRSSVNCDDLGDTGPTGTVDLADAYELTFDQHPDNSTVFNHMHDYWITKGYQPYHDGRNKPNTRSLIVENPHDGFRLGIVEAISGQLTLNISSPCLKPDQSP
jgi:hypothetical protein